MQWLAELEHLKNCFLCTLLLTIEVCQGTVVHLHAKHFFGISSRLHLQLALPVTGLTY